MFKEEIIKLKAIHVQQQTEKDTDGRFYSPADAHYEADDVLLSALLKCGGAVLVAIYKDMRKDFWYE